MVDERRRAMTYIAFFAGLVVGVFAAILILGLCAMASSASGPEMQYRTEEMLERAARESWGSEH